MFPKEAIKIRWYTKDFVDNKVVVYLKHPNDVALFRKRLLDQYPKTYTDILMPNYIFRYNHETLGHNDAHSHGWYEDHADFYGLPSGYLKEVTIRSMKI